MSVLFSQEFGLEDELTELNIFDAIIDSDSPFFINLKRLQYTETKEFVGSYQKINGFFTQIGMLLKSATDKEHKNYRTALKMFHFSEVNGINLGFSNGKSGSGFGKDLQGRIISDAFDIIKTGSEQPEIFHLSALFEEGVGPDRISDMTASLVYENIVLYSRNMYQKLGITPEEFPTYQFEDGIVINPYKNTLLLLLPKDILHELPIALGWDDIGRVCQENEAIRAEINEEVAKEWYKMSSSYRKDYLKEHIFKQPEKVKKIIEAYDKTKVEEIDVEKTAEYLIERILIRFEKNRDILIENTKDSFQASIDILNEFKHWVEEQKGYSVYQQASTKDMEKVVQRTLHGNASYYCKMNNLDISPESNTGRGPVDFKISRGTDKTVVEIKLSTNDETLHGFEVQIEEYAKSEQTDKKIFLIVDNGENRKNIEKVLASDKQRKQAGENPAHIIIIDARPKDSASKYKPEIRVK